MSDFYVDEFLHRVDTVPPTTEEQRMAIEDAHVDLDRQWSHLPPALAQRAAVLLQLRERIYDEEIRSL